MQIFTPCTLCIGCCPNVRHLRQPLRQFFSSEGAIHNKLQNRLNPDITEAVVKVSWNQEPIKRLVHSLGSELQDEELQDEELQDEELQDEELQDEDCRMKNCRMKNCRMKKISLKKLQFPSPTIERGTCSV